MTSDVFEALTWLSETILRLKRIDETLSTKDFIQIVKDICHRSDINYESSVVIPYEALEGLVDILLEKGEYLVSQELLTEIEKLPQNSMITEPLVNQQVNLLLSQVDELLQERPDDIELRMRRISLRYKEGQITEALEDINDVIDRHPYHSEALRWQITILLSQKKHDSALSALNYWLDQEPENEFALYQRSRLHHKFHYTDLARLDSEKLQYSEIVVYALLAAQDLFDGRQVERATDICQRLLSEEQVELDVLQLLSICYKDAGAFSLAKDRLMELLYFTRQQSKTPGLVAKEIFALRELGDIQLAIGNTKAALDLYLQATSIDGFKYDIMKRIVKITLDQNDQGISLIDQRYLDLINHDPSNLGLYIEYAENLSKKGDPRGGFIKKQLLEESQYTPDRSLFFDIFPLWLEPNMRAVFEKGIPTQITLDGTSGTIPYIDRLPWKYSVKSLVVLAGPYDYQDEIESLFQTNMPALREIKIEAERFGFYSLQKMINVSFAEKLTGMIFTHCDFDAPSLKFLLDNLPRLRYLCIQGGDARDHLPVREETFAERWTTSDQLQNLEHVELNSCFLCAVDVSHILSADLPNLHSLTLTGNNFEDVNPKIFLSHSLIQQLDSLIISYSGLEKNLVLELLENPDQISNLKQLGVASHWETEEIIEIKTHRNYSELETVLTGLDVEDTQINWSSLLNEE